MKTVKLIYNPSKSFKAPDRSQGGAMRADSTCDILYGATHQVFGFNLTNDRVEMEPFTEQTLEVSDTDIKILKMMDKAGKTPAGFSWEEV